LIEKGDMDDLIEAATQCTEAFESGHNDHAISTTLGR